MFVLANLSLSMFLRGVAYRIDIQKLQAGSRIGWGASYYTRGPNM